MKRTIIRRATKAILFATALLATGLCTSSAQTRLAFEGKFEGKFTLPYAAHWGEAVLPAGDYLFSISTTGVPAMVTVQDAKSGRTVALVAPPIRQDSSEGESALFVGTRGAQRVIYSLRVSQLGVVFISDPALARGKRTTEEARKTDVIPVLQAKR